MEQFLLDGEDDDLLGSRGVGQRTDAENGLYNGFCRMDCVWRAVIKFLVQIDLDFILSDAKAAVEANWNDL